MSLPDYECMSTTAFMWGTLEGLGVAHAIDQAYTVIVHWLRNLFQLPLGKAGKNFIREQTHLLSSYAEGNSLKHIGEKATMTMPALLKPSIMSKAKDHAICLERRLQLWFTGDIDGLVWEGESIQQRLTHTTRHHNQQESQARAFACLLFEGKVHTAPCMLSQDHSTGMLNLDHLIESQSVHYILKEKHPSAQPANPNTLDQTLHQPCKHITCCSKELMETWCAQHLYRPMALQAPLE